MPKKALGRGLDALISQNVKAPEPTSTDPGGSGEAVDASGVGVIELPIEEIKTNPNQPRKQFDPEKIQQLAMSIQADGVLQPVVVRRKNDGYELIMGERRMQASRVAGVETVPAIVREDVRDRDSLRLALVENIQRENLNAIEVAEAYRSLLAEFGLTQAELADLVGRDRSSVANTLRLLNLPQQARDMIMTRELSEGHARALLALPTQKEQLSLAKTIVDKGWSVRQAEQEAGMAKRASKGIKPAKQRPAYVVDLEDKLSSHLGTKVHIDEKRGGKGKMTIEFYSHDDFERLASLLHLPLPR